MIDVKHLKWLLAHRKHFKGTLLLFTTVYLVPGTGVILKLAQILTKAIHSNISEYSCNNSWSVSISTSETELERLSVSSLISHNTLETTSFGVPAPPASTQGSISSTSPESFHTNLLRVGTIKNKANKNKYLDIKQYLIMNMVWCGCSPALFHKPFEPWFFPSVKWG